VPLRREHRQEQENMKTDITDLKCRSMKNNLIFAGLFQSPREYTEGILKEFIKNELGIEEYIEFGNVHRFGRRETPDRKPRPIVARFAYLVYAGCLNRSTDHIVCFQ
jgi:hypothetical protein